MANSNFFFFGLPFALCLVASVCLVVIFLYVVPPQLFSTLCQYYKVYYDILNGYRRAVHNQTHTHSHTHTHIHSHKVRHSRNWIIQHKISYNPCAFVSLSFFPRFDRALTVCCCCCCFVAVVCEFLSNSFVMFLIYNPLQCDYDTKITD